MELSLFSAVREVPVKRFLCLVLLSSAVLLAQSNPVSLAARQWRQQHETGNETRAVAYLKQVREKEGLPSAPSYCWPGEPRRSGNEFCNEDRASLRKMFPVKLDTFDFVKRFRREVALATTWANDHGNVLDEKKILALTERFGNPSNTRSQLATILAD